MINVKSCSFSETKMALKPVATKMYVCEADGAGDSSNDGEGDSSTDGEAGGEAGGEIINVNFTQSPPRFSRGL
jgi:hypothetical protein